jgi:beta-glucosidase
VTVTNTGGVDGTAVAQLYLTDPAAAGEPPYQLKGFQRVPLAAGASQRVEFTISQQDMSYFQTSTNSWEAARGTYQASIGGNELDHAATASWSYQGHQG